jgi:hypothetical protein
MLSGRQIILRGAIEIALEGLDKEEKLHELRNLQCAINFMIEQLDYDNQPGEMSRAP